MDRDHYQIAEDFLNDASFRRWVLSGDGDGSWGSWVLAHPEMATQVREAKVWVLAMGLPEESTMAEEAKAALGETWEKIRQREQNERLSGRRFAGWWKVAAAAVLILSSTFFIRQALTGKKTDQETVAYPANRETLLEKVNASGVESLVTLSDGSSIVLLPGSRLRYPAVFDGAERKVYLSGEAFFEISKNPQKPFYVFANELVTRVVGTSFRIKAYRDQPQVEVSVRTGKVNVYTEQASTLSTVRKEIALKPDESIRFERQGLTFSRPERITERSAAVGHIEHYSFEFTDTPVSAIFDQIEKAYPVKVEYPESLKNCYLSSSLTDEPLPEKLKIICESLGKKTSFQMDGQQIKIISEGCH